MNRWRTASRTTTDGVYDLYLVARSETEGGVFTAGNDVAVDLYRYPPALQIEGLEQTCHGGTIF